MASSGISGIPVAFSGICPSGILIGIDHHEEILPSQEQMDFEAAQRHSARLDKMAKEMWEKRKTEKR